MIKLSIIAFLTGIFCASQSFSQTLNGYVIDQKTGESLPNVNIYSATSGAHTISNEYGYFSIKLEGCPCQVSFSYVGFVTKTIDFSNNEFGNFQNIELKQASNSLNEITIKSSDQERSKFPIGLISIPVERLKKVPALFGETDVLKALALTPGVSTATEGTAGVLVRGGSPDQNLIMLDETPVYNVTHLFGLVSVFNPDAVQDIKLYKAGFPARYGGRLSSVIDINSKEGSSKKSNKEFSLGLINSRLLMEGPIETKSGKNLGTYLAAARLTNLSLLLLPSYIGYLKTGGQYFNYNLYDLNLKWSKAFSDHSQLIFSVYNGNDIWYVKSNNGSAFEKYKVNWGNFTSSLRYIKPIGQKVFLKNTAAFSSYGYGLGSSLIEVENPETFIKSKSTLSDLLLKSTLEFYPNSKSEIFLGGELTSHQYTPVNISTNYGLDVPGNRKRVNAFESAVFGELNTEITPWLALQAGFRYATFKVQDTTYYSPEPRLSLAISPFRKTTFKLGYSKMGQFLHLLNSSSGGLPNDLWIPASKNLPFERSRQFSAGISQRFGEAWRLDFDVYQKDYTNLIDYKTGQNFIINSEENYEELIEQNGIGESYGFEAMLDKTQGRFTGWLAYTYAINNRRFDSINEGRWFAANFDRRHVLNITGAYQVSPKVNLSANWVYQSGRPVTVPIATHSNSIIDDVPPYRPTYIYGDRNNFRTPAYHRLDINASFTKENRRNNVRTLSLGVYNAYNHNNSFFLSTETQNIFKSGISPSRDPKNIIGWNINVTKNNFIPFLPYISYSLKFK